MNKVLAISLSVVGFCVVTAVCYLWGYWGTFNVDVINHIELSQLIVLATVPLLGICIMMLLCVSLASVLRIDRRADQSRSTSGIGSYIRPEVIYTLSLVAIIVVVVIGGTAQWLLLAIPFAFFTSTFIVFNNIFHITSINKRDLFFIVLISTLLPSLAFGYGKTKGLLIELGVNYNKVVSANGLNINKDSDLRFLGTVGRQAFILDGKNQTRIIVNIDQLQPLITLSNQTPALTPTTDK